MSWQWLFPIGSFIVEEHCGGSVLVTRNKRGTSAFYPAEFQKNQGQHQHSNTKGWSFIYQLICWHRFLFFHTSIYSSAYTHTHKHTHLQDRSPEMLRPFELSFSKSVWRPKIRKNEGENDSIDYTAQCHNKTGLLCFEYLPVGSNSVVVVSWTAWTSLFKSLIKVGWKEEACL